MKEDLKHLGRYNAMLGIHALDENPIWNLVDLPKGEKKWDVQVSLCNQS